MLIPRLNFFSEFGWSDPEYYAQVARKDLAGLSTEEAARVRGIRHKYAEKLSRSRQRLNNFATEASKFRTGDPRRDREIADAIRFKRVVDGEDYSREFRSLARLEMKQAKKAPRVITAANGSSWFKRLLRKAI